MTAATQDEQITSQFRRMAGEPVRVRVGAIAARCGLPPAAVSAFLVGRGLAHPCRSCGTLRSARLKDARADCKACQAKAERAGWVEGTPCLNPSGDDPQATQARPGTPEKVRVMQKRAVLGYNLFRDGDAR